MKSEPCEYSFHDRYHNCDDDDDMVLAKLKKMWAEDGNEIEEAGEWIPEFREAHARWVTCPHCVKARQSKKEHEERLKEFEEQRQKNEEEEKKRAGELLAQLQDYVTELKDTKQRELELFTELDWEEEFRLMDEDPDYTPIQLTKDLRAGWEEVFRHAETLQSKDPEDRKLLQEAREEERAITASMRRVMREKFDAADEVLRPSFLYCERCERFGDYNSEERNHMNSPCKPVLDCKICGHKSTSYQRHRAHINFKHLKQWKHKCEACQFNTDSKTAFERHTHCAGHLEKIGTPKVREFRCETCDKTFRFKSEKERHDVSKRHGLTLTL
jgi:hypothetical protein